MRIFLCIIIEILLSFYDYKHHEVSHDLINYKINAVVN